MYTSIISSRKARPLVIVAAEARTELLSAVSNFNDDFELSLLDSKFPFIKLIRNLVKHFNNVLS